MSGDFTLTLRIAADGRDAANGLRVVSTEVDHLSQSARGNAVPAVSAMSDGFGSLAGAAVRLAGLVGAGLGLSELASSFMEANASAGKLRAALETVTGSTQAASAAWSELQQFAASTPFSLEETVRSFVKLKAMGLDPSREAMLSYANTASAMGKSLNDMIEAVADASQGEFERLKEFGVSASKQGDQVSMTFQGVTTTIANSSQAIEGYLRSIGQVQFAGAIERQAETLGVAMSNVGDSWDQLLVEIGDAGLTDVMVGGLREVTDWINQIKDAINNGLGSEVASTVAYLSTAFSGWCDTVIAIVPSVTALVVALGNIPDYAVVIRDGTLALEEQGTAWGAILDLVSFAAQSFLDLPDNLTGAVTIILGEIDILKIQFQAGMDSLGPMADVAWAAVVNAVLSAINSIQLAVAKMVAYVAGQLAGLARDLSAVAASVPEVLDLGGMAAASASALNELAVSLDSTQANVEDLTQAKADLSKQYERQVAVARAESASIAASAQEQVGAIEGVILTTLEDIEAKKAQRKAQSELNAEFAKAVADESALERQSIKTGAAHKALAGEAAGASKSTSALSDATEKHAKAAGGSAGASKALTDQLKAEKQAAEEAARAHDQAVRSVEGLINRYLPAEAAAIDYEEAMKALADAGDDVKLSQDQAGLSADQLRVIQQGLQADLQKTQAEAVKAAGGFAGAWVEAAEQLDDTFAGLWRNLLSNEGDVLGDLKRNTLEWLADLSYQLLLKPLIVPIQGLMMGMAGINNVAGGATGLMGAASNVGGLSSTFSGLSSLASGISSVFSGAAFTGIMNGFGAASGIIGASGYFGGFGATMGLASGAASAGSTAFAIGAAAPYLLPAVIAIGAIAAAFGAFDDKKPRYGTLAAQTLGRSEGLEDNEWGDKSYSKGGFGLMFGITDKGSKNIKAPEMKETFDALADVSKALEDFFGPKLSAEIKDYLDDLSDFGDGLLHLTEDEGDLGGAMARLVQLIGQAAGRTTDEIGKAFFRLSGDLGGSVEEVQKQLQTVIAATVMAVQVSENWRGEVGQLLGLTGAFDSDLAKMLSYSKQIQTEDEITAEAMLRLIAQMQGLADAAFTTGQSLDGLDPKKLVQIADDLATQFGGVENLTKAVGFYMANFMTAGELALRQVDGLMTAIEGGFANLREDLSQDFANLGEVMPTDWLDQIPQTRAAFVDLVQSLDLTTEAGRVAYKGLMDLAPAFDALFDAVENFQKWIDPAGELERATERVRAVFQSLGLEMPNTYEALQQLYRSGALSAEQMAVLAAILGDLDIVFKQTGDGANVLTADMWGLSGAFAQAMEAITAAIADTRSQISDFGLTDAELYDRYLAEARRLQESLSSLDSAEQVEEVTRQINDLIRSAWGVLDDAERSAAKDQFIGYLDDLEQAAADRLKAIQDATNAEDEPLMQAAAGFGEAALNFGDAVDGFDASVAALADVVGALDQIQSQQAAYTAAVQNQPAFSTVAAPDTSVYQSMAAALTAAAADLRSAAAEYQKAGATMDGAAKGMTTAGAKIASAAADIPSAIAITVTATGATATVEASF